MSIFQTGPGVPDAIAQLILFLTATAPFSGAIVWAIRKAAEYLDAPFDGNGEQVTIALVSVVVATYGMATGLLGVHLPTCDVLAPSCGLEWWSVASATWLTTAAIDRLIWHQVYPDVPQT